MTITASPTESNVDAALRAFMLAALPAGMEVVLGQANRVPQPASPDFAVFTPIRRERLATNLDEFVDCRFTASIAGATMMVTAVNYGEIKVGSVVFGVGLATPTSVTALGAVNPDGTGTYTVSPAQTIASEVMAAGVFDATQSLEQVYQVDVYGPNAADNVNRVSTLFRDDWGVRFFAASAAPEAAPLYADDPKQIPFVDGESQWEDRWVLEAHLQVNATVKDVPQQFFEQVLVTLIAADAKYAA